MADRLPESPEVQACQSCRRRVAVVVCSCRFPLVLLCEKCRTRHQSKTPNLSHILRPISFLRQDLQLVEKMKRAKVTLQSNVSQLDSFTQEFTDSINAIIDMLVRYRNYWLEWAAAEKQRVKDLVDRAIEEVEACLGQGREPAYGLARAMWTLEPEQLQCIRYSVSAPEMRCDLWTVYSCDLQQLCDIYSNRVDESEVTPGQFPEDREERKLPGALSLPQVQATVPQTAKFAAVWDDYVELLDMTTRASSRHTIPVNFGSGGSYLQLDASTLLCVGALPKSASVYSLDLTFLQLASLPHLCTPRAAAGVAKNSAFIYVFGGFGEKSCEKFGVSDRFWRDMEDMHYCRWYFTPCPFRSVIYLAGDAPAVESFSPESETFTVLPISLPPQLQYSWSVAFVARGELCVLTYSKQMARWKIDSESAFRVSTSEHGCSSTQPPLITDSVVFIADRYGEVKQFDLDSYTFR